MGAHLDRPVPLVGDSDLLEGSALVECDATLLCDDLPWDLRVFAVLVSGRDEVGEIWDGEVGATECLCEVSVLKMKGRSASLVMEEVRVLLSSIERHGRGC